MRLNITLAHKAFILVAIPLLFEFGFVYALSSMLQQAELETAREWHAKEVVMCSNELTASMLGCAKALASMALTGDHQAGFERYDKAITSIREQFRRLNELNTDKQIDETELKKLEGIAEEVIKICDESVSIVKSGRSLEGMRNLENLRPVMARLGAQADVVSEKAHKVELEIPAIQAESRRQMRGLINLALIFNVLFALMIALFYSRSINSRLRTLMDNTRRLVTAQPMLPPVGGTDEIAHLDRTFRDMADALDAAHKKEKEITRMKEDFISMVSHDLRTPLSSLQIYLHLLSQGNYGPLRPDVVEHTKMMDRNVSRLIDLVSNLLDMDKIESGSMMLERKQTDVNVVVSRTVEAVNDLAEQKGIKLQVEPCDAQLFIDEDRIVQVLVNLVSNAIKFSPEGETVTFAAEVAPDSAEIRVIDRGRGIPEEKQQMLFQKYKQVETADGTKQRGSGLGLAIARALVEQHGGTLGVTSTVGSGSTFWMRLPVVAGLPAEEAKQLDLKL